MKWSSRKIKWSARLWWGTVAHGRSYVRAGLVLRKDRTKSVLYPQVRLNCRRERAGANQSGEARAAFRREPLGCAVAGLRAKSAHAALLRRQRGPTSASPGRALRSSAAKLFRAVRHHRGGFGDARQATVVQSARFAATARKGSRGPGVRLAGHPQ